MINPKYDIMRKGTSLVFFPKIPNFNVIIKKILDKPKLTKYKIADKYSSKNAKFRKIRKRH